jgi:mannose-1-phosphate guanylyltransferase
MLYAVIMAGGVGSRFWPASTRQFPKQFLHLFGERTMIQNTVDRLERVIPKERVLVVTNERYVDLVKEQLPEVPENQILGEPVGRNTAPCVALAAAWLAEHDPEATMAVLPADHHILNSDRFCEILSAASEKAESKGSLVTIGIEPNRPETGYGYIQFDDTTEEQVQKDTVHPVKNFTEKPDLATAETFLKSGDYLWNSGMFIWSAQTILQEFHQHLPEINALLPALRKGIKDGKQDEAIAEFYDASPSISVDYGIMEKAEHVYVIPGSFGWNDVGSWKAVYELGEKDEQGNVLKHDLTIMEGSRNSYVSSVSDKLIALVGMDHVAVVETEDALLICDLNNAQGVKHIVNALRADDDLSHFA